MLTIIWCAYISHWLLIVGWCLCHWQISAAKRRSCRPLLGDLPHISNRTVTVILTAKDEEQNLAECALRILAQRGIDLNLRIVDDRSSDDTPAIADHIAAGDPRCQVIHNRDLPAGWLGKSHACWLGAANACGEWLLFTDADVRLEPAAIASAIQCAQDRNLTMFSLWLRDDSVGFWEKVLIPLCGAMIVIWYGHVSERSDARGNAFANGQFLLVRRDAYEACGGHRSVRDALIEDIPLAHVVARSGRAVGSALGPELGGVRMYRSLTQAFRGWERIFVGVLTPLKIAGCVLSILAGSVLPMILVPIMLWAVAMQKARGWPIAWLLSGATQAVVLFSVSFRFFSLAKCDLRYLWAYPVACCGVIAILLSALANQLVRQSVSWSGTRYSLAREPGNSFTTLRRLK